MRTSTKYKMCFFAAFIALGAITVQAVQGDGTRAGIEATNKQFSAAVAKGDAGAIADLYTMDAMVLAPNADIAKGREAIKAQFQGLIDAGIRSLTLTTIEVESLGQTATEVALYELKAPDGTVIDKGKSVVIWKKVKGAWKLHRDIFNSSLPPAK